MTRFPKHWPGYDILARESAGQPEIATATALVPNLAAP